MFTWCNYNSLSKTAPVKKSGEDSEQKHSGAKQSVAYADSTNVSFDRLLNITKSLHRANDVLTVQKKHEESSRANPISARQRSVQRAMSKKEEKNTSSGHSTPITADNSDDELDLDDINAKRRSPPVKRAEISDGDIILSPVEQSKLPTLQDLEETYIKNSRKRCLPSFSYCWNRNAFFGKSADVNKTIETLRARAILRPEGTSAKTLEQLGLKMK